MNKFALYMIIAGLIMLAYYSCEDKTINGGHCEYYKITGTASIITVGGADSSSCGETVEVLYNFNPDDPEEIDDRFLVNWPLDSIRYEINGRNFPRRWVEAFGLMEGTNHRCARYRIVSGTCSPIYYEFEGIEDQSVYDSCQVWYGK
jgi:hypothetical protein